MNTVAQEKPALTTIDPPERSRTYRFPDGHAVLVRNVTAVGVRPSGTHRLKTSDGHLHIVAAGWTHIEIDADDWSL